MNYLALPSPAKLNLFLHVTGARDDGYHNIQTAFQLIDFNDHLTFSLSQSNEIRMITRHVNIPNSQNLIVKAATKLQQLTRCRLGCHITLDKRIPIGGGLGGGSSNAATTLLALNKLWKLHLSLDELISIGRDLGADVPVFVAGHSAWAEGIGDVLTPLILPKKWYLLLTPPCKINTQQCFNHPNLSRQTPELNPSEYQLGDGHNDFEPIVKAAYPEVAKALFWLKQYGNARLTGTGSSVFAIFESEKKARHVAQLATNRYAAVVTQGLRHSTMHHKLASL